MTGRRLIGNLAAEEELSGRAGRMKAAVRRQIAGFGALMIALADDGDELWLPAVVDEARLVPVAGLPRVVLRSGDPGLGEPVDQVLPWMETRAVAALAARDRTVAGFGEWCWTRPDPQRVALLHHRAFCAQLREELAGDGPPAAMLASLDALRAFAARGVALGYRRFVAKAPWSAAGRARVIFEPAGLDELRVSDALAGLLREAGELLVEAWCDRTADFGAVGVITAAGVAPLSLHGQLVDARDGRFLGIALGADPLAPAGLGAAERTRLLDVLLHTGARLAAAGHRGPFGIDAFVYRDPALHLRMQPLCEINVRCTMGLLARRLADRVTGLAGRAVQLRLGESDVGGGTVVPLLRADPAGRLPGAVLVVGE